MKNYVAEPSSVTLVTADEADAGTNSDIYFAAYTKDGLKCDFGALDLNGYDDRIQGRLVWNCFIFHLNIL